MPFSKNSVFTVLIALALVSAAPIYAHAQQKEEAPAAQAPDAASDAASASDAPSASDPASASDAASAPDAASASEATSAPDASATSADKQAAAAQAQLVHGPAKVPLGDQAVMDMPQGMVFVPKDLALKILEASGNKEEGDGFYGMFLPEDREKNGWAVVAKFDDSGFIKDDDQGSIKPDDILADMKRGVAESNEDRKARGIPEFEIVGWIEQPHYDSKAHQLIWSVEAKEAGAKAADENSINYNTFALGRGGYISLNLLTQRSTVDADKKVAATLLGDLHFNEGKKYENFDPKTDKIAEYGLMALFGGLVAKKVGLIALAAAFILKAKAVIVAGVAAGFAAVKKFFKRRDPTV